MHEVGMAEDLLAAVEQRAAGRRVVRVRVRIGAQHRVTNEAMGQAFELVAGGTSAAGAALDLAIMPVSLMCGACGHVAESHEVHAVCASCGSTDVAVSGGDEFLLESIEIAPAAPGAA